MASYKLNYFSCYSKKGDRARGPLIRECGPWSANHVNGTERKVTVNPNNFRRRMKILTIFYLFFLIFEISKLQSYWKVAVSIK